MNILAVSYKNIGPFENKIVSIDFKNGKYLIKAPIGSGKSFLFFDGPVFGLYKYSARNILNRKCQEGFVKIFFCVGDDYFLVSRTIKASKTGGETVASSLYRVNVPQSFSFESLSDVINYNTDIQDFLSLYIEEIVFKSQIELQSTLQDFLPPKEVFLSTNFLMQDSDNIFELTPTERIDIFKNIFGLMSIDEAKDIIAENRKEVQLSLKIKSDESSYNEKLKNYIKSILLSKESTSVLFSETENNFVKDYQQHILSFLSNSFFDDIAMIGETVNISGFETPLYKDFFENLSLKSDQLKLEYQNIFSNYQSVENEYKTTSQKTTALETQINSINREITELEERIKSFDRNYFDSLKQQKHSLLSQQSSLIEKIDFKAVSNFGYNVSDIYSLYSLIEDLTNQGKTLRAQTSEIETKILNLDKDKSLFEEQLKDLEPVTGTSAYNQLQKEISNAKRNYSSQIENFKLQTVHLEDKKKQYISQLEDIQSKIDSFSKEYSKSLEFYCTKIEGNCPFVEKIKGDSLETLGKQKVLLEQNYEKVNTVYKNEAIEEKIHSIQQEIEKTNILLAEVESNPEKYIKDFFVNLKTQRSLIEKKVEILDYKNATGILLSQKSELIYSMEKIKNFFSGFDRKDVKQTFENYKNIEINIKDLDKKIYELESFQKNIQTYQEQIISKKGNLNILNSDLINYKNNLDKLLKDISFLKNSLLQFNMENIERIGKETDKLRQIFENINILIEDYKKTQLGIKKMQEEEKILSDLYQVFSKEFMLVVLQDFLPSLSEVINNLLSQVVDYSLRFELIKKASDKLELDIQIYDHRGLRPVKSLSGGQKTILKLVWMLAIGSMMRVKFLFLDETINNLDEDAVGKVSGLLEDFLKTNDIKFYVVTHSQQIQSLDIWDKTLTILN